MLEPGPRTAWLYAAPAREFPHIPTSLFLFLVLEWALSLRQVVRKGYFSVFLFSTFISVSASSPHSVLLILLKGNHFLRGTDLSRPSKIAVGICDYLMGLVDYEKACLLWGS